MKMQITLILIVLFCSCTSFNFGKGTAKETQQSQIAADLEAISFESIADFENSAFISTHHILLELPENDFTEHLNGPIRAVPKQWQSETIKHTHELVSYPGQFRTNFIEYLFYDSSGNILEEHYYTLRNDTKGIYISHLLLVTTYHYKDNILIEARSINTGLPGDLNQTSHIEYYYKDQRISRLDYLWAGELYQYQEYQYENNIRTVNTYTQPQHGEADFYLMEKELFDKWDNLHARYMYSESGHKFFQYLADYDESGKKIESREYDAMMGLLGTWIPEFNNRGQMIKEQYVEKNGGKGSYFKYYYDDSGRLIKTETYAFNTLKAYIEYIYSP